MDQWSKVRSPPSPQQVLFAPHPPPQPPLCIRSATALHDDGVMMNDNGVMMSDDGMMMNDNGVIISDNGAMMNGNGVGINAPG